MPWCRLAVLATFCLLVSNSKSAEAQQQRFMLWGSGGLSHFSHPDLSLGRPGTVGGFIGVRLTDNISIEGGLTWASSDRRFTSDNIPLDDIEERNVLPAFEFKTTRYHLDSAILFHLGRRQPFNPYVLGGIGMVRREERQADYDFNMDDFSILGETVTLETVETEPTFFVGAGFDLYFKHNLAARAELRWRIAENKARSSKVLLVGARYFF